jgi:hypothetical protein
MNPCASRLSISARALGAVLLLALLLGGNANALGESAAAAPDEVIRDFYKWYVGQLVAEKDPFIDGTAELKRFVSDRLLHEIDTARKSEEGAGSDPFLDAQDFDEEWAKNITVATPTVSGDTATATVELQGAEMGTHKLKVALVREEGSWKIDRVEGL